MGLLSCYRATKSRQAVESANESWQEETTEVAMVRSTLSYLDWTHNEYSVTVVHDDLHWSNNHRNTLQTALAVRAVCFHQSASQMGGLGPFEFNMDDMGAGLPAGMMGGIQVSDSFHDIGPS